MARSTTNPFRDTYAPLAVLFGDVVTTFGGLLAGYWLRYHTPLAQLGLDVSGAHLRDYLALLLLGAVLLISTFAYQGLYDGRMLLRRYQSLNIVYRGAAFWFCAYLGVSLVLKFNPPISRLFAVVALLSVLLFLTLWRTFLMGILSRTTLSARLRRRTILLGWNANSSSLLSDLTRDNHHPYAFAGVVTFPSDPLPQGERHLGTVDNLAAILEKEEVDLLIATRLDLRRGDLAAIVDTCERAYVEWRMVPTSADVFLSGLRLQTIGRTPVLGVEQLAITRLFHRAGKRAVDVVGAFIGLVLTAPLIALSAALIKRESPDGPVLFRQRRIGSFHRPFTMYKLRTMRPDAARFDNQHQSTALHDPRLLQIGTFLRRWNLDELPQFWNVLIGNMSLVGPRPERPYHVDQLSTMIRHYLPRHMVKPGITGWAQIHGLRGSSSLELRAQYDLYYIEHWSLWLDLQILALTFLRWKDHS